MVVSNCCGSLSPEQRLELGKSAEQGPRSSPASGFTSVSATPAEPSPSNRRYSFRVYDGDQVLTEAPRTTVKPIARFKVRTPEPARRTPR
ncbi:hypothetical protein [Micromonospora sp. NPDC005305]|uniref:hypothetical protein n=1 Tax=Micromonospora sp. NPDC005305 TaxID=3156875 RepID=UPI0033B2D996